MIEYLLLALIHLPFSAFAVWIGWHWRSEHERQRGEARLYFEAHVTIDPVFDHERELVEKIAQPHGFRLAKLIMRKREADAERPAQDDTFMTGHGKRRVDIQYRTRMLVEQLRAAGFRVRRYKIEDTVLDSRTEDELKLLT